ncbi:MAG TPA: hypothetical protein VNC61_07350 [Acidimicrobiales bacterium]|nr:hypothetical protein [Acidimicrobiales bacterium]
MLVLMGTIGFVLSVSGTSSAAGFGRPTITAAEATFKIPAHTEAIWTLNLWSHGTLEGTAMGTTGVLTVVVPTTADCTFQADVRAVSAGGASFYYAGFRATVPGCGTGPPVQSIAGHIYLCTDDLPTTTEVSGGTLAATGATPVVSQPNPVTPTGVTAGAYIMSAGSPDGFTFVLCGGAATIGADGQTASQSVTVPSGGAGVGLFYVTGPPLAAGGGTAGPNPVVPGAVAAGSGSTVHPAAAITTSATPVASSHLAFTGIDAAPPVFLGLLLMALGSFLVIFSRARRVSHPRPARIGAETPPVPRRP